MQVGEDYSQLLEKLGLSINESKIYLGALRTGKATAKAIATSSEIGREDTYRVLLSLQGKGLIKKYIDKPAKYEVIPPSEAMRMLLLKRKEQSTEIESLAKEFSLVGEFETPAKKSIDEKTFVVFRDMRSGVDSELINLIRQTKRTLDFTTRYKLFSAAFDEKGLSIWIDEMYYAAKRGVKFRMIMDKPRNLKPMSELRFSVCNSKHLLTHRNFDFRCISEPPECILILFDKKASCIEIACQRENNFSQYMVTNNPALSVLTEKYFESLWDQSDCLP